MATPIPKSDVPVEKAEMNATYGLSPNRTSIVPYFTNPFKEFATVHGFVLKWRERERMAGPAINLWSPCTDRSALERRKFLLECETVFTDDLEKQIPDWAAKEAVSEILVYWDIEDLRRKVIPGRDINRYFNVGYMHPSERYRFTMRCAHCHQTSLISYANLRDRLESIEMYQKAHARYVGHFPYHRYPFVICPKCKKVILFPGWMQLIDRVLYVPTLLEGALEIGWMDMRNSYIDWELEDDKVDVDNLPDWVFNVTLNESYPCCWFPYTNKYLRELKIEYIRIGERRISINDFHRLFTRVFDDTHGSGSGAVRRPSLPSRRRKR